MTSKFKIGLCQMEVVDNKELNLQKAEKMIKSASDNGAELIVLPEMFNCPYDNLKFSEYAESKENSTTLDAMSNISSELGITLIAGSIPEKTDDGIYNTSFILNSEGNILGFHRKMHLFDIDVPGKITFKESDTLSSGNDITVIETEFCKIGLGICYDMRFPELSRLMTLEGADILVFPGAFNMTTGPAHWEILLRCRALDNQIFVAAASPARDPDAPYVAYGHSMVTDPWGNILAQANAEESIVYAEIDLNHINRVKNELPLLKNRRNDIYQIKTLKQ